MDSIKTLEFGIIYDFENSDASSTEKMWHKTLLCYQIIIDFHLTKAFTEKLWHKATCSLRFALRFTSGSSNHSATPRPSVWPFDGHAISWATSGAKHHSDHYDDIL